MELKKLDKSVLKLWYIRAAIISLALIGVFTSAFAILTATGSPRNVTLAVLLGIGIPVALLLCLTMIMPALRYKMYAWGYDDKRIVVKQGVIFRQRVVIPVCQIQDLHRTQGPLMMLLNSDDDSGGNLNALFEHYLIAGNTYYIAVQGYNGGSAVFSTTVTKS